MYPYLLVFLTVFAAGLSASPADDLIEAAKSQVGVTVRYDPTYQRLRYPGGDVPLERGVCTDVIVRAYRALGLDLQKLVHEDMLAAPRAYPRNWGGKGTDTNIDHRRVPNLEAYFKRHGQTLAVTREATAYAAGDIVVWRLSSGVPHIGIVGERSELGGLPLVVHNIGAGARIEDVLFDYTITGHYRWLPGEVRR